MLTYLLTYLLSILLTYLLTPLLYGTSLAVAWFEERERENRCWLCKLISSQWKGFAKPFFASLYFPGSWKSVKTSDKKIAIMVAREHIYSQCLVITIVFCVREKALDSLSTLFAIENKMLSTGPSQLPTTIFYQQQNVKDNRKTSIVRETSCR